MAITKEQFKQAFREVISAEFSDIPRNEDEINFTFSQAFERRMEKLIKSQKKPYWKYINTASKRAAVIFAAILVTFTASLSVDAIRVPVIEFFIENFGTHDKYTAQGDTRTEIEKIYSITKVPDGFTEIDSSLTNTMNTVTYKNESDDNKLIVFTQTATDDLSLYIDNEQSDTIIKTVEDKKLYINIIDEVTNIVWAYDGYCFQISTFYIDDMDIILDMVKSVE